MEINSYENLFFDQNCHTLEKVLFGNFYNKKKTGDTTHPTDTQSQMLSSGSPTKKSTPISTMVKTQFLLQHLFSQNCLFVIQFVKMAGLLIFLIFSDQSPLLFSWRASLCNQPVLGS